MQLTDFTYQLPTELIATYPLPQRSASKLLVVDGSSTQHLQFNELVNLIQSNDLLVFNSSKVIPARLRGHKPSGGKVEILIEKILNPQKCLAHIRASKTPKIGSYIICGGEQLQVISRANHLGSDQLFILGNAHDFYSLIQEHGEIPLPPYFKRLPNEIDHTRYQTVYAKEPGSVAAPTAGLHFDQNLLNQLEQKGVTLAFVTLHVGSGTFLPVRSADITQHKLHKEYISVSSVVCEQIYTAKQRGGRIIAVGTTSARSLETAAQHGSIEPYEGDSDLFIYPGYEFKCIDAMITNFHLPESSLLMLVCALGGYKDLMNAYNLAIEKKYRFYSYGDAMFVSKAKNSPNLLID